MRYGGVIMAIFGFNLSKVESRLFENMKKTKSVFPEETQHIEFGLALMWNLTQVTQEAVNDYKAKPNLYANLNLFGRNRQLLLNAYFCMLCSNYGTQFVILRTVLDNNNLMRLFNKNPQYAFEWLPKEKQAQFPSEIQLKYGKSGIQKREFKRHTLVRKQVFKEIGKEEVWRKIEEIYNQLSDYTHPNFLGWRELMGQQKENEILMDLPVFVIDNAIESIKITLYLIQLSFKTFVETFKDYTSGFADQLEKWQDGFNKLIVKYV
jgi:hypothetical protein